jgi:hypothetical protein
MGLYDTVIWFGDDQGRGLSCPEGHSIRTLQTKDFDSGMETYYVHAGLLYRDTGVDHERDAVELNADTLALCQSRRAERVRERWYGDNLVTIYAHCEACRPVCTEGRAFDLVDTHYPWCEWTALFNEDGQLTRIKISRVETREMVRAKLRAEGIITLPDDDRIVQKVFAEQLERRGRRGLTD